MTKRPRKRIASLLVAATILILPFLSIGHGSPAEATSAGAPGPVVVNASPEDSAGILLLISHRDVFGEMQRPPVLFDHSQHAEELKEQGCQACHIRNSKGEVSYRFFRWTGETDRRDLIDSYHQQCMKCHGGKVEGMGEAHEIGCGECHIDRAKYKTSEWYPAMFEHSHHMDAMERGCETCHHSYDEENDKLTYEKGQEEACGNCHQERDRGKKAAALRKVGHTQCIGCHEKQFLAGERKQDPYACQECHKAAPVPSEIGARILAMRPYEARPKNLLISYPASLLPQVPFDHEKHDPQKKCSKSCHQFHVRTLAKMDVHFLKTGTACRHCHSLTEKKMTPNQVAAEKIYHDAASPDSCIGCHSLKENVAKKEPPPVTCKGCHTGAQAPGEIPEIDWKAHPDGPQTYIISRLSRTRLPVEFKHELHVKMIDNCAACHHHSPENQTPPCDTCHGASADFTKESKIKLVGAYHQMCVGCHRNTGMGPITCKKCHEEKDAAFTAKQPEAAMPAGG